MLNVRKIQNKIPTKEEIIHFCNKEKQFMLDLVPEKKFLDYIITNKNNNYQINCLYRNISIYKYFLNSLDENDINLWILAIYRQLCKIICQASMQEPITFNEKQFLLKIIDSYMDKQCILIINNFIKYLDVEIKQKLIYSNKYLNYIR